MSEIREMQELFQAIPAVVKRLGKEDPAAPAFVFAAWRRVAGERLRQRTEPLDFAQKRLTLAVESETWRRHLQDLSGDMLYSLNAQLGQGTVKFIEFRIDPSAIPGCEGSLPTDDAANNRAISPALRRAADSISDQALRENFLGAAGAYLTRQKLEKKKT